MKQETLFSLDTPYRQSLTVDGFRFGEGRHTCAIVGSLRGNEIQQMYVCSQLVQALDKLERQGALNRGHELLVIPCVNHFSMNVGSRFWMMDNSDINRMFPGFAEGETTQRIAKALFDEVSDYEYGIQFASFYQSGDFLPHVRIMHTGYENASLANLFGLPYVVVRKPRPIDTGTLNYNWQIWNTAAFSLYTRETDAIDTHSARQAVSAVLRFLNRVGVLKYSCHNGYMSTLLHEEELAVILTSRGGLFRRLKSPGEDVDYNEVVGEVLNPLTGEVEEQLRSPNSGTIFFAVKRPLVTQHTVAFRVIRRMHR